MPPKTAAPPELVPPPNLPAHVVIPAGTRIPVVLDTPLSTRIARQGQVVTFRTAEPLPVGDQLAIPPETGVTGTVVEVKKPGHFGKEGKLRVKVDRIELTSGASANLLARIDSADLDGQGHMSSDNNRATDLYSLIMYSAQGTLLGAQIKGGKGAAVGAGAGAAVALLLMMSRRGRDVYLEPGMPFQVVLERDVSLSGKDVFAAQAGYARAHAEGTAGDGGAAASDPRLPDPGRPVLKRRPHKPKD